MNVTQTATILQSIVRRESRSFLQYVNDAFPWTTANARAPLAQLQTLIDEECSATAALNAFLLRRHAAPPYLGTYPEKFTTLNFVTLDYLLPLLVEHQRRAIADLDRDLGLLSDAEASEHVRKLLEMKRRHLETLQALSAKQLEPAVP